MGCDSSGAWKYGAVAVEKLPEWKNPGGVTWIAVDGTGEAAAIHALADMYKIHALTVEDILNTEQRPKVEEFENYVFICLKAIKLDTAGDIVLEQVSLVIGENTVLSFHTGDSGDPFEQIRRRISGNSGRTRRAGTDYLAWALMDSVVDEYFSVLEKLGSVLEDFEDRAVDEGDRAFTGDLQQTKRKLLRVRRAIWPLRESLSLIIRLDNPLLGSELAPFFRDLYENLMQAAETLEVYRELVSGLMEVNLNAVSNRMNKVMKVLTVISTVFIPLTFIAGVYGMNFRFMPELEMRYAYPVTWGVMAAIAGGMLIVFKKKDWF
jgi:magnesium transporter